MISYIYQSLKEIPQAADAELIADPQPARKARGAGRSRPPRDRGCQTPDCDLSGR
jgi:hypothetical protein